MASSGVGYLLLSSLAFNFIAALELVFLTLFAGSTRNCNLDSRNIDSISAPDMSSGSLSFPLFHVRPRYLYV